MKFECQIVMFASGPAAQNFFDVDQPFPVSVPCKLEFRRTSLGFGEKSWVKDVQILKF